MIKTGTCITLEGREYLCFDQAELGGVNYLYLITTEAPTEIVFAETSEVDGEIQARIVGNQDIKQQLFEIIREKITVYKEETAKLRQD